MADFYKEVIDELKAEIPVPISPEGPKFPTNLEDIDQAFEYEYTYSLQEFGKIAYSIAHYPVVDAHAPLTYIEETDLIKYIEKISKVKKSRIEAFLENMSINHELLKNEVIEPWKYKSRPNRLMIKPLLKITQGSGDYYLFGNWVVDISARVWFSQIVNGRLPINIESLKSKQLKDALQNQRQRVSKQFEDEVLETIKRMVTFAERVTDYAKFFGMKGSLPGPGEIDTLAIDKQLKKVFVFEAKDIVRGLTPRDVKNEMQSFFKSPDGYVYKLLKKYDFVKRNLGKILYYYNIDEKGWKVEKAFVTSLLR